MELLAVQPTTAAMHFASESLTSNPATGPDACSLTEPTAVLRLLEPPSVRWQASKVVPGVISRDDSRLLLAWLLPLPGWLLLLLFCRPLLKLYGDDCN